MGRNSGSNRGASSNVEFGFSKGKTQDLVVAVGDIVYAQYRQKDIDGEIDSARRNRDYKRIEELILQQSELTKNLTIPARKILNDSGIKSTEDLNDFIKWSKKKYGIIVNLNI